MKATTTTHCFCCRNNVGTDHHIDDDESNYQELSVSKGDSTLSNVDTKVAIILSLHLYHDVKV